MDCIVHGVAKSRTRLSYFHFHFDTPPVSQPPLLSDTLQSRCWLSLSQADVALSPVSPSQ